MLDKSDNDKKLSAATQKRIEEKRNEKLQEDNKEPISYDNVQSQVFKGPKNKNFFKQKQSKSKKTEEIQIFTSGDHTQFDYAADMKKHQEQEAQIKREKAQDADDIGIQIFEGKRFQKEDSKEVLNKNKFSKPRFGNEENKAIRNSHEHKPVHHSHVKDPEDVPIQIFVKGNPHREHEILQENAQEVLQESLKENIQESMQEKDDREIEERLMYSTNKTMNKQSLDNKDVKIEGEEYEISVGLLRQHQEMMKHKTIKSQNIYDNYGKNF